MAGRQAWSGGVQAGSKERCPLRSRCVPISFAAPWPGCRP